MKLPPLFGHTTFIWDSDWSLFAPAYNSHNYFSNKQDMSATIAGPGGTEML
jgi:hypothetical protein